MSRGFGCKINHNGKAWELIISAPDVSDITLNGTDAIKFAEASIEAAEAEKSNIPDEIYQTTMAILDEMLMRANKVMTHNVLKIPPQTPAPMQASQSAKDVTPVTDKPKLN